MPLQNIQKLHVMRISKLRVFCMNISWDSPWVRSHRKTGILNGASKPYLGGLRFPQGVYHLKSYKPTPIQRETNEQLCTESGIGSNRMREQGWRNQKDYLRTQSTEVLAKQGPNLTHCLFLWIKFYWHTATPIHLCLVNGLFFFFLLQWHSRVAMTDTAQLVKAEIFISSPSQNVNPWSSYLCACVSISLLCLFASKDLPLIENPDEAPLLKFSTEVSRNNKQSLQTHAAATSPFEDLFPGCSSIHSTSWRNQSISWVPGTKLGPGNVKMTKTGLDSLLCVRYAYRGTQGSCCLVA